MDLLTAAAQGPEALAKVLAALPKAEWEKQWMQLDATIVHSGGFSYEAFMSFCRIMMYDPTSNNIMEPAKHHLKWIRAAIENDRVCILAPPESAKTTILGILFVAFMIGNKPARQNMVVSVSDDQAEKIVGTIATYIEQHPGWQMCFPDIQPDKKRGWGFEKGFFVKRGGDYGEWLRERGTRKDPTLLGVGYSNRAIIGKRVDGVMLIDDMMDETNTRSDAELDLAKAIFAKTISSRVTEDGKMVLIGTPWREDDVYATAVATGLYANFITPAWEEKGARLISYWPEQWPIERLESKRIELGERSFRLMYLMDLEASKGTILKEEWLHPYFMSVQIDPMWPMYYGIDFAITSEDYAIRGRGKNRSYFSLAKIVAAPFGLVLVDGIREHLSFAEAIDRVRTHSEVDRPKMIKVETWGAGQAYIQQLHTELPGLNIQSYQSSKDKTTRFIDMSRHFEFNRIRVSDAETPWLKIFKDEWVGYPSYPSNDTLDSVAAGIDATGYVLYSGDKFLERSKKSEKIGKKVGWGGMGMPKSKFAPSNSRVRR